MCLTHDLSKRKVPGEEMDPSNARNIGILSSKPISFFMKMNTVGNYWVTMIFATEKIQVFG